MKVQAPDSVFQKNSDFIPRKIAGELVLIPLQRKLVNINSIYNLNEVGCFVWDLIDGKRKTYEIKKTLCKEFEVSEETASEDLQALIDQLLEIKAIALA